MRKDYLYHKGFSDGVDDCDNKEPNMAMEASRIDYGNFYLDGYEAGYKEAATKSWLVVSYNKQTRKVQSYYVALENGNTWTKDRIEATRFKNKKVVYEKLNNIMCNLGRGEYGVIWERNEQL